MTSCHCLLLSITLPNVRLLCNTINGYCKDDLERVKDRSDQNRNKDLMASKDQLLFFGNFNVYLLAV